MTSKYIVAAVTLTLFLTACVSTDPYTGSASNEVISVQYGTIENIQQVDMKPSYGKDSLIGGALGLLAASSGSSGTQAIGAAAGAGLGALVAKESAGKGQRYTVRLVSGNDIEMVTEQQDLVAGDCVSVEQGKHANIRRVSPVMCSTSPTHAAYDSMHASVSQEAAECHQVKQELVKAKTEEQTDIAYRKMRALCDS